MTTRRQLILLASSLGALAVVPRLALASQPNEGAKPVVVPSPEAVRYRKPTPGNPIETGGAVIIVNAPLPRVREVVTKYRTYKDILPRLEQSRVIDKKRDYTDVYMRVPILRGVAHVWGIVRFWNPRKWGRGEKLIGSYVSGNVNDWRGMWRLYPCGQKHTVLRLELMVDLKIPLPASMITPELEWASDKGVTAVRDKAECRLSARERGTE